MKVKVRVEPKGEHKTINIEAGSTIKDLIAKFEKKRYSIVNPCDPGDEGSGAERKPAVNHDRFSPAL